MPPFIAGPVIAVARRHARLPKTSPLIPVRRLPPLFPNILHSHCHDGARLWQRYGYERVLRDDAPTQLAVAYTLENPVRAGLVKEPRDYPFIGSSACTVEQLLEYAFGTDGRWSGAG